MGTIRYRSENELRRRFVLLYTMKEMLNKAYSEGYAVPQPDFVNIDMAATYIEAASHMASPIILGFGESYLQASGTVNLRHLVKVIDALADEYKVPVVLHLDHGSTFEVCAKAINAGFTSVMIDGSALTYDENVELTTKVVNLAKLSGVSVEGEIGRMKSGKGYDLSKGDEQVLTDPETARKFILETGVDALAVSIGSVHGEYQGEPNIRTNLLEEIKMATRIPLVLHGASGISYDTLTECARLGISKVNIFTDFAKGINKILHENYREHDSVQIPELIMNIKQGISKTLSDYIIALGSENKNY